MGLKIQVHEMLNFSKKNKAKYLKACKLLERVLNSTDFREEVLNYFYLKDDMAITGFHDTQKTRKEIYDDVMSGRDNYGSGPDGDIDIKVKEYYSPRNTVGYTYKGSLWTYINRKYLSRMTPEKVAANIIHEAMHKKGYIHSKKKTPYREHSVPYAMGTIVKKLINKPILHTIDGKMDQIPKETPSPKAKETCWDRLRKILGL